MSYTVKLAIFPPWKAPDPYETLDEAFTTIAAAAAAGAQALALITERELTDPALDLQPRSQRAGERWVTAVDVPEGAVHGYLIFDEAGVETFNWTTLDVAVARAAKG